MNFKNHLDNLEKELYLLNDKIVKARENENWGTYKNLILSYKEILNLISNFNVKAKDDFQNSKLEISTQFRIKEIRCNSNYKMDKFKSDCPIIIDDSVAGFEFIVIATLSDKATNCENELKITRNGFRLRIVKKAKEIEENPHMFQFTDCLNFIHYIYKASTGLNIGNSMEDIMTKGDFINHKKDMQLGDIVFFEKEQEPHHMGIYIGNNNYISINKQQNAEIFSYSLKDEYDFLFAKRYL